MRKLIIFSMVIYLSFQVGFIFLLASEGQLGNLTFWNSVRPVAMLVSFTFFLREGGRWALWLAMWSGFGVLRFILNLPSPPLGWVEAISELLVAVPAAFAWHTDPHRDYYSPRLLDRLRARFLPPPNLIVIPLGTKMDEIFRQYKMVTELESESFLKDCRHFEVSLRDQKITLAIDEDEVKGVIYNTPIYSDTELERIRKLGFHLKANSHESPLRFIVNNGFGFLYRSKDGTIRASYSYAADIFSISRFSYEMV